MRRIKGLKIDKGDRITIAVFLIIFVGIFIIGLLTSCSNNETTDTDKPVVKELIYSDSYSIDTLTLLGHRYFLIRGNFGHVSLQHEESCREKDLQPKHDITFQSSFRKNMNTLKRDSSFTKLK